MSKTMAEVLAEHDFLSHERTGTYACSNPDCGWEFRYRRSLDELRRGVDVVAREFAAHQAAALTAAGFGLVADAKREALEEAADARVVDHTTGVELFALGINIRVWLRARAAAVRGEG